MDYHTAKGDPAGRPYLMLFPLTLTLSPNGGEKIKQELFNSLSLLNANC